MNKKLIIIGCFLSISLLEVSCTEMKGGNNIAPMVTPFVSSVGKDSVVICWNNVGNEFFYSVVLGKDTVEDNEFRNMFFAKENIFDTFLVVHYLDSNTLYKAIVHTFGENMQPNCSFPLLLFHTLE
jgi:hypothetical protein